MDRAQPSACTSGCCGAVGCQQRAPDPMPTWHLCRWLALPQPKCWQGEGGRVTAALAHSASQRTGCRWTHQAPGSWPEPSQLPQRHGGSVCTPSCPTPEILSPTELTEPPEGRNWKPGEGEACRPFLLWLSGADRGGLLPTPAGLGRPSWSVA